MLRRSVQNLLKITVCGGEETKENLITSTKYLMQILKIRQQPINTFFGFISGMVRSVYILRSRTAFYFIRPRAYDRDAAAQGRIY